MKVGQYIRELRQNKGISQEELGKMIGVKRAAVQKWECGTVKNLKRTTIQKLADYFGVSPATFVVDDATEYMEANTTTQINKGVKIPVLGTVAAGIPIEAIENIIDYEEIPEEMARTGEFFALKIKGDSMAPRILDGDVVIVKKQSDVDSGDIAIVLINGDEATVKCLKKQSDGIILTAYNIDVWEPKYYSKKDIQTLPVAVLGKVVELRGKF